MVAGADLQSLGRVAVADHLRHHGHGTGAWWQELSAGGLDRQLVEHAKFIKRSLQVVEDLDVFTDLRQGREDEGDDQFTGHELPERELAVDDQPAAQAQDNGAPHGLEQEREERLSPDHAEVPFAGRDVGIGQIVGAVESELAAAAKTKRVRALGNLF